MSTDYDHKAQRRTRNGLVTPLSPAQIAHARYQVAELAVRNTDTDAEAVEATRDVLDMLGIGGAA